MEPSSMAVMIRASARRSPAASLSALSAGTSRCAPASQRAIMSSIIPRRPMARPSSGE